MYASGSQLGGADIDFCICVLDMILRVSYVCDDIILSAFIQTLQSMS